MSLSSRRWARERRDAPCSDSVRRSMGARRTHVQTQGQRVEPEPLAMGLEGEGRALESLSRRCSAEKGSRQCRGSPRSVPVRVSAPVSTSRLPCCTRLGCRVQGTEKNATYRRRAQAETPTESLGIVGRGACSRRPPPLRLDPRHGSHASRPGGALSRLSVGSPAARGPDHAYLDEGKPGLDPLLRQVQDVQVHRESHDGRADALVLWHAGDANGSIRSGHTSRLTRPPRSPHPKPAKARP